MNAAGKRQNKLKLKKGAELIMNKKLLTWLLAASIAVIFVATGLNAGTTVPDTIKMDSNAYTKRTKTPPKFLLLIGFIFDGIVCSNPAGPYLKFYNQLKIKKTSQTNHLFIINH